MSAKSQIEWTDATWTPIRARVRDDAKAIAESKGYTSLLPIIQPGRVGPHCEHASPGCLHCYSESNNGRCLPTNGTGLPFDRRSRDLVEPFVDEKILVQPLRWRKPRKIFPCSQTDLFGEWVTDEQIDRVFAVMALCPQHTFQVLTKQPARMLAYLTRGVDDEFMRDLMDVTVGEFGACHANMDLPERWPLPNVWLGVSTEDQQRADERIPLLLQTPAAVRFVSYEPALGPVDFKLNDEFQDPEGCYADARHGLHWIIGGAESGRGARPMDEEWMRSAKNQCVDAGVAFFYKQNAVKGKKIPTPILDGRRWIEFPTA